MTRAYHRLLAAYDAAAETVELWIGPVVLSALMVVAIAWEVTK